MTGLGDPIQVTGANVTANYLETLGVHPILGRNFLPEEESKGRRRDGDGKLLAQPVQLRPDDPRPQHHTERRADHHRRRAAESADRVVRT